MYVPRTNIPISIIHIKISISNSLECIDDTLLMCCHTLTINTVYIPSCLSECDVSALYIGEMHSTGTRRMNS